MTELVIKEDGSLVERTISESIREVMPSIQAAFQSNVSFNIKSVLDFSDLGEPFYGPAAISANSDTSDSAWWSVRVRTLNLNTAFKLEDGVLTPDFFKHADAKMQLEMPWRPPEDMRLVLGVLIKTGKDGCVLGKHYLIAYDKTGNTWRLPLPNLYTHLELCHGQEHMTHPTSLKSLMVGLQRFKKSLWNSDLFCSFQEVNAPRMFRFKPVNSGFEQLPTIANDWTKLCEKVSNSIITTNFQPV